jgi:uncharacterized repeat protein (TIGR04042 family)
MPEVHFRVQWPDLQTAEYYSPSTAVHAHFKTGESYPVPEFLSRSRAAMRQASERVRQRYGYYCSSAMDTLQQIEARAEMFRDRLDARVTILACGPDRP